MNLAYSTYIGARLSTAVEHSIQAEYILKSALNFARVLIQEDTSPDEDGIQDIWGKFSEGTPLPAELLGIREQNVQIELEIRPEDSKLPLSVLQASPSGDWRQAFASLFRSLGFDEDKNEVDESGYFSGKHFTSEELVANIIDFMDADSENYSPPDNFAEGVEEQVPKGVFPNARITRMSELAGVPGFTATRVRKITPFVTVSGAGSANTPIGPTNYVNINFAPPLVVKSLHPDITDEQVQQIVAFRSAETPFTDTNKSSELQRIITETRAYTFVNNVARAKSTWFQVLAKVSYGTSVHFLRASIYRQPGTNTAAKDLPRVFSMELF